MEYLKFRILYRESMILRDNEKKEPLRFCFFLYFREKEIGFNGLSIMLFIPIFYSTNRL